MILLIHHSVDNLQMMITFILYRRINNAFASDCVRWMITRVQSGKIITVPIVRTKTTR